MADSLSGRTQKKGEFKAPDLSKCARNTNNSSQPLRVPQEEVAPRLLENAKLAPLLIVTPFATTWPTTRFFANPTLKKPSELNVKPLRIVSIPGRVKLWPGVRNAPLPAVPTPRVTAPATVPAPPKAPDFTCMAPLPVADPLAGVKGQEIDILTYLNTRGKKGAAREILGRTAYHASVLGRLGLASAYAYTFIYT